MLFSGVRPFGVSLLICGYDYDEDRPFLYQCDPSVSFLNLYDKSNLRMIVSF